MTTPTPEIEKLAEYLEDNTGLWNHKPGSTSNLDVVQVARLIISREAKLREEMENMSQFGVRKANEVIDLKAEISTLKEKLAKAVELITSNGYEVQGKDSVICIYCGTEKLDEKSYHKEDCELWDLQKFIKSIGGAK